MEGMTFSGPDGLNAAIPVSLNDFNEKVMAGREASRKEMFLRGEKDCLRPLPLKRYVMKGEKLIRPSAGTPTYRCSSTITVFPRNMWGNA